MGVYTSIFTWIWLAVYTLPQFHEIIHVDKNVSTAQVLFVYFVVTVANALHSWSYYELIERTGNVTSYLDMCFSSSSCFFLLKKNRWLQVFYKV